MKDKRQTVLGKSVMFFSLGGEVAGTIGAAALLGYWLDEWLKTTPWVLVFLIITSSIAIFWRILKMLARFENQDKP